MAEIIYKLEKSQQQVDNNNKKQEFWRFWAKIFAKKLRAKF